MQPSELKSPKPPNISDSTIAQSNRTLENSPKKKRVSLCKKLEVVYIESFKKFNTVNGSSIEIPRKKRTNEIKCNCMVF